MEVEIDEVRRDSRMPVGCYAHNSQRDRMLFAILAVVVRIICLIHVEIPVSSIRPGHSVCRILDLSSEKWDVGAVWDIVVVWGSK